MPAAATKRRARAPVAPPKRALRVPRTFHLDPSHHALIRDEATKQQRRTLDRVPDAEVVRVALDFWRNHGCPWPDGRNR